MPALALMNFSARRWRFALGVAACLLVPVDGRSGDTIATDRSFFGVYRMVMMDEGTRDCCCTAPRCMARRACCRARKRCRWRTTAMKVRSAASSRHPPRVRSSVAVIGLGTGSLACYAQPGQDWTFYEIDPLVERIARDPRYFQFLRIAAIHRVLSWAMRG